MCPSLTPKGKKERHQESFYQTYFQEALKVFEWLSMTFPASFLKTETLVMENYCPAATLTQLVLWDGSKYHNGGIFGKGGRGVILNPEIYIANFGPLYFVTFPKIHPFRYPNLSFRKECTFQV